LGIEKWELIPIPKHQSPIPNPQSPILFLENIEKYNIIYI